jgi:hypothetical protein
MNTQHKQLSNQEIYEHPTQTTPQPRQYEHPTQTTQQPIEYEHPTQTTQQPKEYEHPTQTTQQPREYEHPTCLSIFPSPFFQPHSYLQINLQENYLKMTLVQENTEFRLSVALTNILEEMSNNV